MGREAAYTGKVVTFDDVRQQHDRAAAAVHRPVGDAADAAGADARRDHELRLP